MLTHLIHFFHGFDTASVDLSASTGDWTPKHRNTSFDADSRNTSYQPPTRKVSYKATDRD